jgi:Xaa-Pro aminopeptidase
VTETAAGTAPPVITAEEISSRVTELQARMVESDLSSMVCFGAHRDYAPADLWYLARWSCIDEEVSFVFVPRSGETTLVTDAPWDLERAREEAVAGSVVFDARPADTLAELIGLHAGNGDRVGVSGMRTLPAPIFERLSSLVPGVTLEDAQRLTEEQRMVKSELEIGLLREAARISDLGMAAGIEAAVEGANEFDVVAEAEYRIRKAGAELSFTTVMGAGSRTGLMTFLPKDRSLARGDLVVLDCGARVSGYHGDMCRSTVVGDPGAQQLGMLEAVRSGIEAGIEAARPGAIVRDIHDAAKAAVTEAGFGDAWWGDYMPHGIGAGQHEPPIGLPDGDVVLRPGMCLCIEPGVGVPGVGGVVLEQMIQITQDGRRVLNTLPLDLWER